MSIDTPQTITINKTAMIQGMLTFVGAITVVELIKEIPNHLKDYVDNVLLMRLLVTFIVILLIVIIVLLLEDDETTIVKTSM